MSLLAISKLPGMPAEASIRWWVINNPDGSFAANYAQARDIGLDHEADEIKALVDAPIKGITKDIDARTLLEQRRLQVDARKWRLSKMAPKRYGDKVTAELSGPAGGPIEQEFTVRFVRPGEKKAEPAE